MLKSEEVSKQAKHVYCKGLCGQEQFDISVISVCLTLIFFQATTTLTTNDIVINKLTQILSYLRQGRNSKKLKKLKGTVLL